MLIGLGQSIFEGSLFGRILGFTTRLINPGKLINKVKAGESIFENSPLDERTRNILNKSKIPVGVLIDKNFSKTDKVFLPIFEENDGFLIDYAQKLINNSDSQIVILDANSKIKNSPSLKERIRAIEQKAPNNISVLSEKIIDKEFFNRQDLMIISIDSWKNLIDSKSSWLPIIPSALIIKES